MSRTLSPSVRAALDHAIDEVLYAEGLHEGTVDAICRRAGVGKPALYRHVGGRDAILVDYLQRRRTERMACMERAVAAAGADPRARVLGLVDWVAGWISSDGYRGCGFHRAALQRPSEAPELLEITLAQKRWMLALLTRELAPLVADPEPLARHLFLLVEGAMAAAMYERTPGAGDDLRRLAAALVPDRTVLSATGGTVRA